jgi:hypothetical protein
VGRRLLLATLALVAVLAVPAGAQGIVLIEDGTQAKTDYFEAGACSSSATISLAAPSGATSVETEALLVGDTVTAFDGLDETRSFATVTDVATRPSSGRLVTTWTATPDPALCEPSAFFDDGWYSVDRRFAVSYRKRERLVMTRTMARRLTYEAMDRMFSFWESTYGDRYRCQSPSRHRGRCRISFIIGDGVYDGYVTSRISTDRRHRRLLWSYRASILLTDEYCLFVSHQPPCHRRYNKGRTKVRFPGWVR